MGEEAALGGGQCCLVPDYQVRTGMIVSNRLDTSKESVVSNKDVEKLGIPHLMHIGNRV